MKLVRWRPLFIIESVLAAVSHSRSCVDDATLEAAFNFAVGPRWCSDHLVINEELSGSGGIKHICDRDGHDALT